MDVDEEILLAGDGKPPPTSGFRKQYLSAMRRYGKTTGRRAHIGASFFYFYFSSVFVVASFAVSLARVFSGLPSSIAKSFSWSAIASAVRRSESSSRSG